jgi:hypothetical protein
MQVKEWVIEDDVMGCVRVYATLTAEWSGTCAEFKVLETPEECYLWLIISHHNGNGGGAFQRLIVFPNKQALMDEIEFIIYQRMH